MINTIADVGKVVGAATGGDILEFLIPDSTRYKHIIGLNLDLTKKKLNFDIIISSEQESLSKESLMKVLYVPSEKGNRPQFSPTTENLSYLVSQTLPNLCEFLADGELKDRIERVIAKFFVATDQPNDSKYGKILSDRFLESLGVKFIRSSSNEIKKDVQDYVNDLSKAISNMFGTKPRETLYTVLIDGEPIASHSDYRAFLVEKNLESAFEESIQSKCSVCGNECDVTQDTTRFQLKFYMIDKISFAPFFEKKNFYKAVALCKTCYENLLVGEKWIDRNLRTRLGGFDLYLLPQLIWSSEDAHRIFKRLEKLPDEFNEIKNIQTIREKEVKAWDHYEASPFIWNFLFFRKAQSAFKILTLIKDVSPSLILQIYKVLNSVESSRKKIFPESAGFDLDQIYWIIPIKKSGAEHQEYRKVLQIYYNIFNEVPFNLTQLYGLYTQLAHTHHFQSYTLFQIKKPNNPDWTLINDTLKWNLFLHFLRKLNLIKGEVIMDHQNLHEYFPSGMKEVLSELNYNPAQQGLALLGYVLGAVANAQYKEGLENKPVLEKINYQGMTHEKVLRLFNELFEKIRQYKNHIGFAERWWAAAKKLYESGDLSPLTTDERVFYLLSGYAFNLLRLSSDENKSNN